MNSKLLRDEAFRSRIVSATMHLDQGADGETDSQATRDYHTRVAIRELLEAMQLMADHIVRLEAQQ